MRSQVPSPLPARSLGITGYPHHALTPVDLPLPLHFPCPHQAPLPPGWALSTASDFLPLVSVQMQPITRCQTNLSSPFPSCNPSEELTQAELPVAPQPSPLPTSPTFCPSPGQHSLPPKAGSWDQRMRGGGVQGSVGQCDVPLQRATAPGQPPS